MDVDFPRMITLLRKEKGISQREAAEGLGISQARLSHYENGIRECKLDFVVRCAEYYSVSCDYLLGRTPDKKGTMLAPEDIPEGDLDSKERMQTKSVIGLLGKRLVCNSVIILFDLLERAKCAALTKEITNYLMLAVYRMYRLLYEANPKNPRDAFSIPEQLAQPYAQAAMEMSAAKAAVTAADDDGPQQLRITEEGLAQTHPKGLPALLNLLRNAEKAVPGLPESKR